MSHLNDWQKTASTPLHAHACNCVGCCPRCGTCRTWHGHTPDWCAMVERQMVERATHLARVDRLRGQTAGVPTSDSSTAEPMRTPAACPCDGGEGYVCQ